MIKDAVITILSWIISIGLSIGVMMFGWGIQPKNWWWILGAGVAVRVLVELMALAGRKVEK